MLRKNFVLCFIFILIIKLSYSDAGVGFSENNSIEIINNEVFVATHFSSPHMVRKGYIYSLDLSTNKWKLHSFSSPILSIAHSDSSIWLGTYGGGLIMLKDQIIKNYTIQNTGGGQYGQTDGLIGNYINTVVADENIVYCGSMRGLSIFKPNENNWTSFNSHNSSLQTSRIFNLDKKDNNIWIASSNYGYVYYEMGPSDDEKGNIASLNIETNEWEVYSGTRKKFCNESEVTSEPIKQYYINIDNIDIPIYYVNLPGEIPIPNSNFSNLAIDSSGSVWFAFHGGIGVYNDGEWKILSKKIYRANDMVLSKNRLWIACQSSLLEYNEKDDIWTTHMVSSDKIPGSIITSICAKDNSIWIKSYSPNYNELLKVYNKTKAHNKVTIDGDKVRIVCKDKNNWKELYDLCYMEYLTVYENGIWKSWELTRMLIEELVE